MKSRTSFFNLTALTKNITRFAPVWVLYTVFLLLSLFLMNRDWYPAMLARDVWKAMGGMTFVNLVYGGICAVMLLGDLFNTKICNTIHAFPLRREGWLWSHITSGFLFCIVPNALIAILAAVIMLEYAYMALLWFTISTLQFLFFFGTGVLSAVCAGNRLAMAAIYAIIHFITMLVYALVNLLYQPLLYGIELEFSAFANFFPVYQLVEMDYVIYDYNPMLIKGELIGLDPPSWRYLCLCSGFGLVALALSFVIYRKRALETAGDFISLKPIAPVFLVIYTLGMGAVFYLFSDVLGQNTSGIRSYIYLAVGLTVGFFTGLMLLSRSLKVFTKKSFVWFGVLVAVLGGSMVLTWLDPAGVTTRVPDTEDIVWGAVYSADDDYLYREGNADVKHIITDLAELEKLQQLHGALARDRKATEDGRYCDVKVQYALKDGSRFIRHYRVAVNSELGQQLKTYFSDLRYIFRVNNTDVLYDQFVDCEVQCYDCYDYTYDAEDKGVGYITLEEDQIQGLLDAMQADCEAGVMVQSYAYHDDAQVFFIDFTFNGNYNDTYRFYAVNVYESCVNTASYIQELFEAQAKG